MTIAASSASGRLVLVRHGESEGNRTQTFTESPLVPLTPAGRAQARRAGQEIARRYQPVRLVASPFTRAQETAFILAAVLGLPVEIEPVWREQSLGRLAGKPYDSVLADPNFDWAQVWTWRPPDGESLVDVRTRIAAGADRLLQQSAAGDIVVVTHAGVMQAVWAHVTGAWTDVPVPPNAALLVIEREELGRPRLCLYPTE